MDTRRPGVWGFLRQGSPETIEKTEGPISILKKPELSSEW
jgi:hypothetical protein